MKKQANIQPFTSYKLFKDGAQVATIQILGFKDKRTKTGAYACHNGTELVFDENGKGNDGYSILI